MVSEIKMLSFNHSGFGDVPGHLDTDTSEHDTGAMLYSCTMSRLTRDVPGHLDTGTGVAMWPRCNIYHEQIAKMQDATITKISGRYLLSHSEKMAYILRKCGW